MPIKKTSHVQDVVPHNSPDDLPHQAKLPSAYLTTNEVARMLKLTPDRVRIYARRKRDRLPSFILGRVRRYLMGDVRAFVERHRA